MSRAETHVTDKLSDLGWPGVRETGLEWWSSQYKVTELCPVLSPFRVTCTLSRVWDGVGRL